LKLSIFQIKNKFVFKPLFPEKSPKIKVNQNIKSNHASEQTAKDFYKLSIMVSEIPTAV
jgi:hypothetical protein